VQPSLLKRVNNAGYKSGLTAVLDTNGNRFTGSVGRSNGFKVLVHNPREYAEVEDKGFAISPGFETFSGMEPVYGHNSPEVELLPMNDRSCYNNDDRILKFYGNYSVSNCYIECLTRKMLVECACRPFFYNGKIYYAWVLLHHKIATRLITHMMFCIFL